MLLFRKMLQCNNGLWLACVSAEKLTEVRLCSMSRDRCEGVAMRAVAESFRRATAASGIAQNDPR